MKRVFLIMLILFLLLTGCIRSSSKTLEADNITIGLSFSSYVMFGADQGIVDNLLSQFNSLSFEKTAEQIDLLTAFHVSFSYKGKGVKSFWVDKKGVFWLDGTTECFKVSSGYLDYQYIKAVYEGSQNNSARQDVQGRIRGEYL
ncbi:hypothetical protein Desor_4391 [Desulfosporosinus orientis DSM 765]|uniref:Lipoprotein n=1 Tax=Desulfosporosinus orientis (strain ATCC 19365 / DSM 765 / NCIMB 8382 / VKM B-1628 / Singapore I) TaxID=768706 RepID=G7WJF4_DESOD|nr:hypothetical protein [Desulfosporosinus orientis]AET69813.1 hypothetical protein Desor_4391 [Desulfosporosinus orientis DSM 765]